MQEDPFDEIPNSFLSSLFNNGANRPDISHPSRDLLNKLGSISALYLYANPPPVAYGTPAPKIAETVLRSYEFNLKKKNGTIIIDDYEIDHPVWENEGEFPFGPVHSNWHPGIMHSMSSEFVKTNIDAIKELADSTIEHFLTTNSDVLTKGRQTWCPITERSVPSAQAYSEYRQLLHENGFPNHKSLIGLIKYTFELMTKPVVIGKKVKYRYKETTKTVRGQHIKIYKRQQYLVRKQYNGEEAYRYIMDQIRSFCG